MSKWRGEKSVDVATSRLQKSLESKKSRVKFENNAKNAIARAVATSESERGRVCQAPAPQYLDPNNHDAWEFQAQVYEYKKRNMIQSPRVAQTKRDVAKMMIKVSDDLVKKHIESHLGPKSGMTTTRDEKQILSSFGPKEGHEDTTTMKLTSDRTFDQKVNRREVLSDGGARTGNPMSEATYLEAVQHKSQGLGSAKIHE